MQDFFSPSNPLLMMIAVAAIFYFLVMRPQQQNAKRLREAINNLRRGDPVRCTSR